MSTLKRILYVFASVIIATACSVNKQKSIDTNLYPILVGDKYGFMDCAGKIIIEPQFDEAGFFSEGLAFVIAGERKGYIDSTGFFVFELPDSVNQSYNFVSGLAKFNCGLWRNGIIDNTGKLIIPATHYNVAVNKDGDETYILVENQSDFYIANRAGDTIGSLYDSILNGFSQNRCAVKKDGKWGYIDTTGELIIDYTFDFARVFTMEGFARVREGDEHFFIDKKGRRTISVDSTITGYTCNRAAVIIDGNKYLINNKGERICSLDYDVIYPFQEKDCLATVIKNSMALKIDTIGNVILRTEYDYVGAFVDGVAPVRKEGKWGFVDTSGNEIIKPGFDEYIYYTHNRDRHIRALQSYVNGQWLISYYDKNGNQIWKDISNTKKELPWRPSRKDFEEYLDDRIAELDPIEGIYYVTNRNYYQSRNNPNDMGSNGSQSEFFVVLQYDDKEFRAHAVDGSGTWVNKFVRLGESNDYAIMKVDKDNNYSSEGRVTVTDPNKFDFQLETGRNGWYNFFVTYEFVKDYPPASAYEQFQNPEWEGSGFAIADGYIATNYHVTHGAKSIRVRGIDGNMEKSYKAFVVASDKEHDISILKVVDKDFESFGNIPYTIGKSMVDVGDEVFVLGYPMTSTMGNEVKLTTGIISSSSGFKGNDAMYQISAAVQPGNSGGPLFNIDGSVIGIVCAKHADAENANYAMKVSYLYSLINSSNLGINIADGTQTKDKKLSKKVSKLKKYVYKIECSSR